MRGLSCAFAAVAALLPMVASAGEVAPSNIPTLGEAGLIVLGVGLAAAGVATFLKKGKRR